MFTSTALEKNLQFVEGTPPVCAGRRLILRIEPRIRIHRDQWRCLRLGVRTQVKRSLHFLLALNSPKRYLLRLGSQRCGREVSTQVSCVEPRYLFVGWCLRQQLLFKAGWPEMDPNTWVPFECYAHDSRCSGFWTHKRKSPYQALRRNLVLERKLTHLTSASLLVACPMVSWCSAEVSKHQESPPITRELTDPLPNSPGLQPRLSDTFHPLGIAPRAGLPQEKERQ